MLALQTLRAHRWTVAGAFVAIWLAVTLGCAAGLLMDGALGKPGAGRFADAAYVLRADPSVRTGDGQTEDATPGPRLPVSLLERYPGAVAEVSFPVSGERFGHGLYGASLVSGKRPRGRYEVATAAPVGARVRVTTPAGVETFRVTGQVRGSDLYFADATARRLAGAPDEVNALVFRHGPRPSAAPGTEVLDHEHAGLADATETRAADRVALVAIFGTMGGIAGLVALFVVAGTFTLAMMQRRREIAVLRALGAAPDQVRRLIAGEALIVSVLAGVLGLLAGRPLAQRIADVLAEHDAVPAGFAPGSSWIAPAAAFGGALVVAQLSVFAAARRAGRVRPAEALRDAAIERPRSGVLQLLAGVLCLGGGVAMAIVFKGMSAIAFAILEGMLLAVGVGLLGRALLGFPAALLARPLRTFGAAGLLASTSLSAHRWRTAALATPLVLVSMLAGTEGIIEHSGREHVQRVTAARVTAPWVAVGSPIPEGLHGTAIAETVIYPDGSALGENAPWPAAGVRGAGGLDLHVLSGDPRKGVAVSRVFAQTGHLRVGDTFGARLGDARHHTLRVAAIYERAAGLGDVLLSSVPAPTTAVFVAHRPTVRAPGVRVLTREQYLDTVKAGGQGQAWGVWMIIGLAVVFTALSLINTAAMATTERRHELATIRLLGGTRGHIVRALALELLPTVLVALVAGAAIVAVSVHGVPAGLTGIPLAVPLPLIGAIAAGAALLGTLATLVCVRSGGKVGAQGGTGARG